MSDVNQAIDELGQAGVVTFRLIRRSEIGDIIAAALSGGDPEAIIRMDIANVVIEPTLRGGSFCPCLFCNGPIPTVDALKVICFISHDQVPGQANGVANLICAACDRDDECLKADVIKAWRERAFPGLREIRTDLHEAGHG